MGWTIFSYYMNMETTTSSMLWRLLAESAEPAQFTLGSVVASVSSEALPKLGKLDLYLLFQ
jgi:multisubunit Na+/H+ antiporter MnhE subunit